MEENSRKFSFTAAGSVPLKIFLNQDLLHKILDEKVIPPYHIQLNPESRCNQNCPWCSCANRDKTKRLTYEEIMEVFRLAKIYGCGSTTITGDGEPLLHPRINDIIVSIKRMNIDVGVVCNGWYLNRLSRKALDSITWMRISLGDKQTPKPEWWWTTISDIASRTKIDMSFSYVLTYEPEIELIEKMIKFANENNFTHIRIVNNIFEADNLAPIMEKVKRTVRKHGIDDSIVIWQSRSTWTRGTKKCYISLLKPVLGSDGYWYSCCGNQYMTANPERRYVYPMSPYRCADGLRDIIENQRYFDGSVCVKCYYSNYNYYLGVLLQGIKHRRFV